MKTKIHSATIEVPEDIAISANGKPAYIKIRTRLKKSWLMFSSEHARLVTKARSLSGEAKSLDETKDDKKTKETAQRIIDEIDTVFDKLTVSDQKMLEFYEYLVLDWNWIDGDTGKPLPKPNDPEVFKALYEDQLEWIQDHVNDLKRYRVTEGNAENSPEQ